MFSSACWSDDQPKTLAGFDPKTDFIADNYEAGPYLIFDCEENHWVCVGEPFYKDCQEKRKEDEKSDELPNRCAPFDQLPTKKSCFQRQLFMTSQNFGNRFCLKSK